MSPQGVVGRSQATQGLANSQHAPQHTPTEPPKARVAKLIQELDDLLPPNGGEHLSEVWEELKAEVRKLFTQDAVQVTVDNNHVKKLTEAVTALIGKQKQLTTQAAPSSYAAALRSGLPTWAGPPSTREVPTRLQRELVVTNPGATPQDRNRPISQIVEDINKSKSQDIKGKVLAARRLPSGDITITTDTAETKNQLERDSSWLTAVN
jgi:hypothetical protein